jgi:undecaprenyl-diphosphatase
MSIFHAVFLGIMQGLSEFFPISSSGHLELLPRVLGWNDFNSDNRLENTFDVALHVGTLAGAITFLWADVKRYGMALLKASARKAKWTQDGKIGLCLLLSAAPAALCAIAIEPVLLGLAESLSLIAILLILFGFFMGLADWKRTQERQREDASPGHIAIFALAQAVALLPGVSRSGVILTAARILKFERTAAARLAFLMALPVIFGAGLYRGTDIALTGLPDDFLLPLAVGMVSAGVTGWIAVWVVFRLLRFGSLMPFVIYRIVLGLSILLILALGFQA